jgi:hypothetical protein
VCQNKQTKGCVGCLHVYCVCGRGACDPNQTHNVCFVCVCTVSVCVCAPACQLRVWMCWGYVHIERMCVGGGGHVRINIHERCVLFKSVSVGLEWTVYMLTYIDFISTGQVKC